MLYLWKPYAELWYYFDASTTLGWQLVGDWASLSHTMAGLSEELRARTYMLAPSSEFICLQQRLPAKQIQALTDKSVGYLLEDTCITPPEQLTIRYSKQVKVTANLYNTDNFSEERHDDSVNKTKNLSTNDAVAPPQLGSIDIIALPTETLVAYQQLMRLGNMTLCGLIPDFVLLPDLSPHSVSCLLLPDGALVRTSGYFGQFFDQHALRHLQSASNDYLRSIPITAPQQWHFASISGLSTTMPAAIVTAEALVDGCSNNVSDVEKTSSNDSVLAITGDPTLLLTNHKLNFVTVTHTHKLSKYTRLLIALGIVTLVSMVTVNYLLAKRQEANVAALHNSNQQLFNSLMAGREATSPYTTVERMQKLVKKHTSQSDVSVKNGLALLSDVGPAISNASCSASSIRFDGDALHLLFSCKDNNAIQGITQTIESQGHTVNIRANNQQNGINQTIIEVQ